MSYFKFLLKWLGIALLIVLIAKIIQLIFFNSHGWW
jgi:hypothetical protein